MTSRVLVSLRVRATPERAFEVFTKDIGLWWKPSELFQFTPGATGVLSFEPEAGGRFVQTAADGRVFEIGRVSAWEPGVRLAFTWRQATFAPGQTTDVEVRFEPLGFEQTGFDQTGFKPSGAETRVTVEHRGWDAIPPEHVARHGFPDRVFLLRHAEWWRAQLERLRESTVL
jgi:uncharacterized protein YndB with AHSA1/START domain